jgi:hypothetical protein
MEKAWDEIHKGADMRVPKVYKFIIKYITPLFLIAILISYFWQGESRKFMLMQGVSGDNKLYILATRLGLLILFIILALLVKMAWRKRKLSSERG